MLLLAFIGCRDFGWRKHIYDLPPDLVERGLRLAYAHDFVFSEVEAFIKLSILWFTRRLLGRAMKLNGPNRYYFVAWTTLFIIIVLLSIAAAIVMALACRCENAP